MQRADSLEQTLMLGKIEGKRRGVDEMVGWHHRLVGRELEQLQERVEDGGAWRAAVLRVTEGQTRLSHPTAGQP